MERLWCTPTTGMHRLRGSLRLNLRAATAAGLAALALTALAIGPARAQARLAQGPLVVELFTAQGCASCVEANQMLAEIAERSERAIALTFPVDYWDYLGWRDTFAAPEFSARQRAYVTRMGLKEIYTPEVVVNGRREAPGVDAQEIAALVESEDARRTPLRRPVITALADGERISVGRGSAFREPADVWLVRFDPVLREVRVRGGDNGGRLVPHANVVRELTRLGVWEGGPRTYDLPPPSGEDLRTVILVQGAAGGPILSASLLPAED